MSKGVVLATSFIVLMCLCVTVAKKRYRTLLYAISALYLLSVLYFTFLRGERADLASISIKPPFYILKAIATGKYRAVTNRSVLNLLMVALSDICCRNGWSYLIKQSDGGR